MWERSRTSIFLGVWLGSWVVVVFDKDLLFGIFILCNIIIWAVLEQSKIITKAIVELIKILKDRA